MPHHIFFEGPLGSGKTLIMTIIANFWREQVIASGGSVEMFSNYDAKNTKPLVTYEDWYQVARADESICMWDESQMAFNNRAWAKESSIVGTELMMYTRKMRSLQMYASPSIRNIDSRLRDLVEILFRCRKIGDKGFEFFIYDYQYGQFLRREFLPMSVAKKLFKLNLYDTEAMVRNFPLPSGKKQIEEFWNTLFDIHDRKRKRGIYAEDVTEAIEEQNVLNTITAALKTDLVLS